MDTSTIDLRSFWARRARRLLPALLVMMPACRREHDGVKLRPDGVHYDLEGARELARELLERLERGAPKG